MKQKDSFVKTMKFKIETITRYGFCGNNYLFFFSYESCWLIFINGFGKGIGY